MEDSKTFLKNYIKNNIKKTLMAKNYGMSTD